LPVLNGALSPPGGAAVLTTPSATASLPPPDPGEECAICLEELDEPPPGDGSGGRGDDHDHAHFDEHDRHRGSGDGGGNGGDSDDDGFSELGDSLTDLSEAERGQSRSLSRSMSRSVSRDHQGTAEDEGEGCGGGAEGGADPRFMSRKANASFVSFHGARHSTVPRRSTAPGDAGAGAGVSAGASGRGGGGDAGGGAAVDGGERLEVLTLPCGHRFHAGCVAGLRELGPGRGRGGTCPLCRARLPPEQGTVSAHATQRFLVVKRRVDLGRATWRTLSPEDVQEVRG